MAKEYLLKIKEADAQPSTLEELQVDREAWQWYLDGLRHSRRQDHQKAIDSWEKVLKKYPNNKSTLDNIEQARRYLQSEKSE